MAQSYLLVKFVAGLGPFENLASTLNASDNKDCELAGFCCGVSTAGAVSRFLSALI